MKFPLRWLQDYVAVSLPVEVLCERLTMAGMEIEGVETTAFGPVLEIEITPNRADCLSIIGMAREIAAVTGLKLKAPAARKAGGKRAAIGIRIEDEAGCQRYNGRLFEDITVGPSPEWLRQRLEAAGVRAINNVVDITNFVLLEYGQPQHAFDFDKLAGGEIRVRRAKKGERLVTLDEQDLELDGEALVIADAQRPVALAGVMGGRGSEVGESTRRVLLETARFDPVRVRRSARRYGISSESSYRFERGTDLCGIEPASVRAAALLIEVCGARETAVGNAGKKTGSQARVAVDVEHLNRWLGAKHTAAGIRAKLRRLDFAVEGDAAKLIVRPPSYRPDVKQEADIAEEIARLDGYDKIKATLPSVPVVMQSPQLSRYRGMLVLRERCAALGLEEVMTWALLPRETALSAGEGAPLCNPLTQDQAVLRPALLPGLIQVARRNLGFGLESLRIFEAGAVFNKRAPHERQALGILLAGAWQKDWRANVPADFFILKGIVQSLLEAFGIDAACRPADAAWALSGECCAFAQEGKRVAIAARVRPDWLKRWDIEAPAWHAEIDAGALMERNTTAIRVAAVSPFPPVKRDLSILVPETASYASVLATVRGAAGPHASVSLADRYTGKQIESGRYSLTFSMEYRNPQRTLTAEEADRTHAAVVEALEREHGVKLRV